MNDIVKYMIIMIIGGVVLMALIIGLALVNGRRAPRGFKRDWEKKSRRKKDRMADFGHDLGESDQMKS